MVLTVWFYSVFFYLSGFYVRLLAILDSSYVCVNIIAYLNDLILKGRTNKKVQRALDLAIKLLTKLRFLFNLENSLLENKELLGQLTRLISQKV